MHAVFSTCIWHRQLYHAHSQPPKRQIFIYSCRTAGQTVELLPIKLHKTIIVLIFVDFVLQQLTVQLCISDGTSDGTSEQSWSNLLKI
jgi:hypothetical protein